MQVALGTVGLVGLSIAIFLVIRSFGVFPYTPWRRRAHLLPPAPPPVRTMTREWQEETNRIALERKQDPITGMCRVGTRRGTNSDLLPAANRYRLGGIQGQGPRPVEIKNAPQTVSLSRSFYSIQSMLCTRTLRGALERRVYRLLECAARAVEKRSCPAISYFIRTQPPRSFCRPVGNSHAARNDVTVSLSGAVSHAHVVHSAEE